jgi:hypothetical protein
LWLIGFGGLFVVLEVIALLDPADGDTLSESLRWLVYSAPWGLGLVAFLGFFVWFIPHILKRKGDGGDDG